MATTGINTQGVQQVRDHLANLPRPDREAKRLIGDWLKGKGHTLDPDQIDVVTLHLHLDGIGRYVAEVRQRVTLTQALVINWQGESSNDVLGDLIAAPWAGRLPTDGMIETHDANAPDSWFDNSVHYQVFNGLFRRSEPARFDTSTVLDISASDLYDYLQTVDFHAHFKAQLDQYWEHHLQAHALCSQINFVAACNKQATEGSLSDAARRLAWRAAGLIPDLEGLRRSTLSIYGYAATDLLYLNDSQTDLTLLYVPGNSSPLLEFSSEIALKDWVGEQCRDAVKRQKLKAHFRLADGPQGVDFSGLDTALEGLGVYPAHHALPPEHGFFNDDGTWAPRTYVNYRPDKYNPSITDDLFQTLAERQRQRSYDDADFLITSNGQVREKRWRHYLNSTLNLVLPLSFVVPGLAPLLAAGGIVQLGLGLDEAINGKTLQDKIEGIGDISYGLFNAAPLAAAVADKAAAKVFESWSDGFVMPTRLNDRIGYPLSPLDPPHLPGPAIAPYFHEPAPIAPLADGDAHIAYSVRRTPQYNGQMDLLRSHIEPVPGYAIELDLVYDLENDAFITEQASHEAEPTFYEAEPGTGNMRPLTAGPRAVSNTTRMRSLRALGVDLPLPVELPAISPEGASELPRQITALWVGDRPIEDSILANLGGNARALANGSYRYRLMLSNRNPAVFTHNLAQLSARAPDLEVLVLEDQPFFQAFQQQPGYVQYEAALTGSPGGASNYASAADVLRYPMLYSEGGLYMDVDDVLLLSDDRLADVGTAALSDMTLYSTPQDLILHSPLQNEVMGMNSLFNSSMIGSHAGNPTLLRISEEMQARFERTPNPYPARPDRVEDPAGFRHFAQQLSRLTGPHLLTDMVDRLLPDLYRLRQLSNFYMLPRINNHDFINLDQLLPVQRARLPLDQVAKVGHWHSWARG